MGFKDCNDIVENINNLNVSRYLSVVPYPYSLKDARAFVKIAKNDCHFFAIVLKSSGKLIGTIGLMNVDDYVKRANIGYWFGQKYWGQGFASEALKPFIKYAFKKLKLIRLQAGIAIENKPSINVLKKARFKKEGIRRKSLRTRSTGKWHDTYVFALLKSDLKL